MNPDSYQNVRSVLELAYFAATIVLAAVGCAALYQLVLLKRSINVTKEGIELRSKREAVTLASERCEAFASAVIPKVHDYLQQMVNAGIPMRKWELVNNEFEKTSVLNWTEAEAWFAKVRAANQTDECLSILNLLESFAMYFTKGAADEQIAYPAAGSVFCLWVIYLAPCLISLRKHEPNITSGPYQNIVTLFSAWSSRIKKEELELKQSEISSELSGIHSSDIPAIGTRKS